MIGHRLRRPCKECGTYFEPDGKYCKCCQKCREKSKFTNKRNMTQTIVTHYFKFFEDRTKEEKIKKYPLAYKKYLNQDVDMYQYLNKLAFQKELYLIANELNRCTKCYNKKPMNNYKICDDCRMKMQIYYRRECNELKNN